jgi:hypothetical protein
MKYILTINQKAILDLNSKHGFKLDLFDALLLEFAFGWFPNSKATKIFHEGKQYVWIAHQLIKDNVPLLGMEKDTIYRRMTKLSKYGFFELHPDCKTLGRTFYAPTALLDSIHYQSEPTDTNPNPYGYKSEPPTDTNPNYNIKNNNNENKYYENRTTAEKSASFETEKIEDVVFDDEPLEAPTPKKEKNSAKKEKSQPSVWPATFPPALIPYAEKFLEYRKEIKKPYKSDASLKTKLNQFIEQAEKYGVQAVIESIETAVGQGWTGTFIDKKYINTSKQYGNHNEQQQGSRLQRAFAKHFAEGNDYNPPF